MCIWCWRTCNTFLSSPVFEANSFNSRLSGFWFIWKWLFMIRNWWCLNEVLALLVFSTIPEVGSRYGKQLRLASSSLRSRFLRPLFFLEVVSPPLLLSLGPKSFSLGELDHPWWDGGPYQVKLKMSLVDYQKTFTKLVWNWKNCTYLQILWECRLRRIQSKVDPLQENLQNYVLVVAENELDNKPRRPSCQKGHPWSEPRRKWHIWSSRDGTRSIWPSSPIRSYQ